VQKVFRHSLNFECQKHNTMIILLKTNNFSLSLNREYLNVNCNFYKTNIENIASKTVLNTDDTVVSCALDLWRNLREKLSILHASLANICCRVTSF
jgi:hypothetical protein